MRVPTLPAVAVVCLLMPTLALSQPVPYPGNPGKYPDVYVCTASGQVVRVTNDAGGAASAVLYANASGGAFDDCVVGPDGSLYIANEAKIVKVGLSELSLPATTTDVVTLPSRARGLAFNFDKLYVTTDADGVWAVDVAGKTKTPQFGLSAGGRGLAFDLFGNMDLVAGSQILQATGQPYINAYSGVPAALAGLTGGYGLAINTCREVVVADTAARTIRRLTNGAPTATNISFPSSYRPLSIEIDSSNRIFMLAASSNDGKSARVMIATPNVATNASGADWLTTCGNFVVSTLYQLKTGGPTGIAGLLSTNAVGLAIGQTAHRLEHTFTTDACNAVFDFGYHVYKIANACGAFDLAVTAYKSRPADVAFASGVFPGTPTPISYSPNGGYVTELTLVADPNITLPEDFLGQYGYFTQQSIGNVGIGKGSATAGNPNIGLAATSYDEAVGVEVWDLGLLDIGTGERERDWSKRVSYTSATRNCTLGEFEQPLLENNPLFNSNQTLKVGLKVSGTDCAGGTMRLSVARIDKDSLGNEIGYTPATVVSTSNDVSNFLTQSAQNLSYQLNLLELFRPLGSDEITPVPPGTMVEFQLTIFGDLGGPKSHRFTVSR